MCAANELIIETYRLLVWLAPVNSLTRGRIIAIVLQIPLGSNIVCVLVVRVHMNNACESAAIQLFRF